MNRSRVRLRSIFSNCHVLFRCLQVHALLQSTQLSYSEHAMPWVSSAYFRTTNLADVNLTVTVNCHLILTTNRVVYDSVYSSAITQSWTRMTVADRHKFLAVRCLSQRLCDWSKNAIFIYPTCILRPRLRSSHRNFVEVFCIIKPESLGHRVTLFLKSYI